MKNMKVSAKLLLSFLIVIILALLVGIFGIIGMNSINNADDDMYNYNLLAISAMGDFREAFQMERTQLRAMILAIGNKNEVQAAIDEIGVQEKSIAAAMAAYEATITDDQAEGGYHTAKNAYTGGYAAAKKGIYEAALAGEFDLAYQRLKDAGPLAAPIAEGLTQSAKSNGEWAYKAVNGNTSLFTQMTFIAIGLLVVAVAVALFLAIYISGLISKPLNLLSSFMQKAGSTGDISLRPEDVENINRCAQNRDETGMCIASTAKFLQHITTISEELGSVASGDLTTKIEVLSDSDVMGMAMQRMVDNLNTMFGEINASAGQVAAGSKQIADGAQSLAQGSTEQAAAVQELSSSIAEIAEKTKINAQMAGKAANLANTIMGSAQKGSAQMDEMMSAVKEINQASQSINKVIKVIDDIAFKTNILALNAAVEAARAGQHGKGFAVVAEEVRNLAAQSAEAAKDTGGLIANSMEKAELGARIADETAASLAEIVSGINESNQLVGDIAKSSDEQSEGIYQINKGIDQVAQVIQQNSATAEESAAASQEMSGQSDILEGLISQFKLKDDGTMRRQVAIGASRQRQSQLRGGDSYNSADSYGDYGKY